MGSLLLFILGVAAPFAAAIAYMAIEQKRGVAIRKHLDRAGQHNRGLKLALNSKPESAPAAAVPKVPDPRRQAIDQIIEDWGIDGALTALDHLKERLAAIAEMEMIWADPHSSLGNDQNAMLERALWVFEPEYVVAEGNVSIDQRHGAVAKPLIDTALNAGHKEGQPTLIVELKHARATIGGEQQMQAWGNVRDLIRSGAVRERDPIDVYVVGGSIDEQEGNPRIEGRYRNVRITSYDYNQLIARAKRLTFGLYDELKESAPFLRQHRADITAAQHEAAEQAANEAAVASAPPEETPAEEPDMIRREEFADSPRRGEFNEAQDEAPAPSQPAPSVAPPPRPRGRMAAQ